MSAFGIYVHVPFCATRCGYCDFNTYTATELGGGASQVTYADTALAEISLAARELGRRRVDTVFFGGGTPTLLPAADLARILRAVDEEFGLAKDVEITTEANPESVDIDYLNALRAAGFTRISFGMQSVAPHVLSALDRQHTPGRAIEMVRAAHEVGFEHVSVDLIYGGPGETDDDWRASLDAAIESGVDHISAYSLIVEDGTRLARQVARGEVQVANEDTLADRYLVADELFEAAGLRWYEVSNWARDESGQCQHNLGYWRGDDWWGIGPGAHSHLDGTRWWNVKHPAAYATRLAAGESPMEDRELLSPEQRATEDVMLRLRTSDGLGLTEEKLSVAKEFVADGLLDDEAYAGGQAVLTRRGRLLADAVIRRLST